MTDAQHDSLFRKVLTLLTADPVDPESAAQKVRMLVTMAAAIHLGCTGAPYSVEVRNEMVNRVLSEWSTQA